MSAPTKAPVTNQPQRPAGAPAPQPAVRPAATPLPGLDLVSTNELASGSRPRRRTVLYKGIPLTGKTYCVGSWAAAGPVLYILWDPKSETIEQFPDVHILAPKDQGQFMGSILPRIMAGTVTDRQGKRVDYATVAMDSLSFYARDVELEFMSGSDEMPDGAWNAFANRLARVLGSLGSLARSPSVPHPAHFVATIHEVDRTKQVRGAGGRREMVADGTLPMISGRIRDHLEGYFDLTLLTCKETVGQPQNPQVRETRYFCRTVGTEKKQAAGGGFGGLKVLPPRVDGTYPGLCKLAGVDPRTLLPLPDAKPGAATSSEEPTADSDE